MIPMKNVRKQLGELLAADTTTLAPVAANKVALIKAAFSAEDTLVAADVTKATFDGSTPLAGAAGAQQCGIDPVTGQQVVTIIPPLGGFHWEASGVTDLPQTIYGYGLYTTDLATLLGIAHLPVPITITEAGQELTLPPIEMKILAQPIS